MRYIIVVFNNLEEYKHSTVFKLTRVGDKVGLIVGANVGLNVGFYRIFLNWQLK